MFQNTQTEKTVLAVLRAVFSKYVSSAADKGHLEVERKFRLSADEAKNLPSVLNNLGFHEVGLVVMTDTFLPSAVSGEMLRVRREQPENKQPKTVFTFKSWIETAGGKERQETEREVRPFIAALWLLIGRLIARGPLMSFAKNRHLYANEIDGNECVVSIDEVNGLGIYSGWYLEVELLVPLGQETSIFRDHIYRVAQQILGEARSEEKRSYREMLTASQNSSSNG